MVDVRTREGGRGIKMRVDEFAAKIALEKPNVSGAFDNFYAKAWSPAAASSEGAAASSMDEQKKEEVKPKA